MSNRGRTYDFERVEAMFGTYIANRYDKEHANVDSTELGGGSLKPTLMEEEIEAEYIRAGERTKGMLNAKQQQTRHDEKKNLGLSRSSIGGFRDNIKTYISHNKGAFWELIRAPETDMKGKSTKCFLEDGCSLHFNIYNRLGDVYHAPPYSSENAVGIVMAVGNTGRVLKKNRGDKKSTYLSRDGGGSFWEIAKVPLIYEFGDHGGILVAAANTEATTQIRYSWNEGMTWTKL